MSNRRVGHDDAVAAVIRSARAGDWEGFRDAFGSVAAEGRWIARELPIEWEVLRSGFEGRQSDPRWHSLLAERDGQIVGWALAEHQPDGKVGLSMGLVEGQRGAGLGSQLLGAIIAWARERGAHKVHLEVWAHNRAALALYGKLGFVVEGRHPRHWRRNDGSLWDSLSMGLVLDHDSPGGPDAASTAAEVAAARPTRSVCVYCSSSAGVDEVFVEAAQVLGRGLGERGDQLVWGGASVGLMGEVARAARAAGGRTVGVIPESMLTVEIADRAADLLLVTGDMGARKAEMAWRADAFVALPGGFGTLEEVLEQLTLRFLGHHDKPIVLVDVEGFWQPLLTLFEHLYDGRFARQEARAAYVVPASSTEALALLDAAVPGLASGGGSADGRVG